MCTNQLSSNGKQVWVRKSKLVLIVNLLLILSMACSLPSLSRSTPSPSPTPVVEAAAQLPLPSPTPLPPALVESDPPPGAEIPLAGPIKFYFNQPMDKRSVEGALTGQPILSGKFDWESEEVLIFQPENPFLPGSDIAISINANARSQQGLALLNPLTISYRAVGYLRLTQVLPEADTVDVNPTSPVIVSFNRPVFPLGEALNASLTEPVLTLDPPAEGRGEWINTSTYVFYPQPALVGNQDYTVSLNPALQGLDGSPLTAEEGSLPLSWSFSTSSPVLVSFTVGDAPDASGMDVGLDAPIILSFNQGMDPDSVLENFSLTDPRGNTVPVRIQEHQDYTRFFLAPLELLERGTRYSAQIRGMVSSLGGTPLGQDAATALYTVRPLRVEQSTPLPGGAIHQYDGITLSFSANLPQGSLDRYFQFTPAVEYSGSYLYEDQKTLQIYGSFLPETQYTLTVSPDLPDLWGAPLGSPFVLQFRTLPLDPSISVGYGAETVFLTPQDVILPAQAVNLNSAVYTLGTIPLDDFFAVLNPYGYELRQTYRPRNAQIRQQTFDNIERNRSQQVSIELSAPGTSLQPGLYYLRFNPPTANSYVSPVVLVVSNLQITFKTGSTDVLVWAVDLRDNRPAAGAPVVIYSENGDPLVEGVTDAEGVFRSAIPPQEDLYQKSYVVVGEPGEDQFGAAVSLWNQGLSSWSFGIIENAVAPRLLTYLYTDRPVYRPGDTVFYRAVVRQAHNGRYSLPGLRSQKISLLNEMGEVLYTADHPLSEFGTLQGQLALPQEVTPGHYRLSAGDTYYDDLFFQVVEYRKPEINLQVQFPVEQAFAAERLQAAVQANYFFGAPASNLSLRWSVFAAPRQLMYPGFAVGPLDLNWLDEFNRSIYFSIYGELVAQGESQTGPDGSLSLTVPALTAELRERNIPLDYLLEVTVQDESGYQVSSRTSVLLHPASLYIGVKPDSSMVSAGSTIGFDVQLFDWQKQPGGAHGLSATFQKVTWLREEPDPEDPFQLPRYTPSYTPMGRTDFVTAPDGMARLAFSLPEPGIYQLDVTGEDADLNGALTQVLVWAAGPGQVVWPEQPNQRLRLTADRERYQPGETAQVFIPNPFGSPAQALVTLERSEIMRHQLITLDANGSTLPLTLSEEDAPNIYLSVTILSPNSEARPDFRFGLLSLEVEPVELTVQVEILQPAETELEPGVPLTLGLRARGPRGEPVRGEFSLSVVDQALLALAGPNSKPVMDAFYGIQPHGIRTGMSLAAYAYRDIFPFPGGGGGGGEDSSMLLARENFRDTAYWQADLVTDANGEAFVTFTLPDNLTSWKIDARGVTPDTKVGQAESEITTSKDLLVRPVAPRFFVAGDHIELAALVHNNTSGLIQADVSLRASGFTLDDAASSIQSITVQSGGREKVTWWGRVENVDQVDLLFSASGAGLYDAVRPDSAGGENVRPGALPVLRYTARQTFATSGFMDEAGERLELVSLPRSFEVTDAELRLELAPSLVSALTTSLDPLSRVPYESNDQAISRLLPNLELYHAMTELGIQAPELSQRLEQNLADTLVRLQLRQNQDGGWGWWPVQSYGYESNSDPYITAYILFGLARARELGAEVEAEVIDLAVSYLYASMPAVQMVSQSWQLDRLAFEYFALAYAGAGDLGGLAGLYEVRSQLNPWSQALLALTYFELAPDDPALVERSRSLFSEIQSSALRTATGVHWQEQEQSRQNFSTPVLTTAMVVYALAQRDPAAPLLPDAVRYLMAHRKAGRWASPYETAWTLLAVLEYARGTGELGANFEFSAAVNGVLALQGKAAGGSAEGTALAARVSSNNLYSDYPNQLVIHREDGPGRLYYNTYLTVSRPAQNVPPLNQGMSISRRYYSVAELLSEAEPNSLSSIEVGQGVLVRISLVVPEDSYYVQVEDFIPSGTEILNRSLNTSAQGEFLAIEPGFFDPGSSPLTGPLDSWRFYNPVVYDQRITWTAEYLPAGTYELTYQLTALYAGEFQVLPASASQIYFPEVQGSSGGSIFTIISTN